MAAILKRSTGDAGAAIDESHGAPSRLYDVLKALVDAHQETVAQFNQFRADYNASTTPTTATDLTSQVTAE